MINGSLQALKAGSLVAEAKDDLTKLKKATDGLEAFMFKSLLQSMGGKDGLFSSKMPGGDIYRDMFETNLSDVLAARGTLNISKTIYNKVVPVALAQAQQRLKESTIEKKV
ncbi:MAG: rod-binding protein [Armatimonadetes bacterium]|nr:hypothetical protein [Armatimonadota bacterium]MBS1704201.1 rod-binding protein [Armatimonadota bacterium]